MVFIAAQNRICVAEWMIKRRNVIKDNRTDFLSLFQMNAVHYQSALIRKQEF